MADKESTDDTSNGEDNSEWHRWSPCSECGSTTLETIKCVHVSLELNEDGLIENEDREPGPADLYVECDDCGTVLQDQIH